MIVDSSAVIAILKEEEDFEVFVEAMRQSGIREMSTASYVECGLVAAQSRGRVGLETLRELVFVLRIQLVELSLAHAEAAQDAFLAYGKGRHPARLNFGDCMSYALAKTSGSPLLFKGEDFTRTDIAAVRT